MRKGGRGPHLLPLPPPSLPLILSLASPSSLSRFYDRSRISIRDRDNRHAIEARREIVRAVGFVQCQVVGWWARRRRQLPLSHTKKFEESRSFVRSFVRFVKVGWARGISAALARSSSPRLLATSDLKLRWTLHDVFLFEWNAKVLEPDTGSGGAARR